jgi:hypothetical protein
LPVKLKYIRPEAHRSLHGKAHHNCAQTYQAGFIPVPILFQVTAVIAVLSLIPLMFIKK